MAETNELISESARMLGSKGGTETLKRYGRDYFRDLNRKSNEAKKKKKAAK